MNSQNKYIKFADPFLGNGEIALPEPSFPASTWHFIKGLSGNTAPAATLPFGKYACHGYDGSYPTGNGVNCLNSGGKINRLFDKPKYIGLTHFCQSGTGAIRVYYNYALTSPFYSEFPDFEPRDILFEDAEPGWYSVSVEGVTSEATVSEKVIVQRHRFDSDSGKIAIDFAADGLYHPSTRRPASGAVSFKDDEIQADMLLSGLTLHFAVRLIGGRAVSCFENGKIVQKNTLEISETVGRAGVIIESGECCEVRMAVSLKSAAHAKKLLDSDSRSFEEIRTAAEEKWEKMLSLIEIETDDNREREIFYSNLYHTLIKPADFSGENFLPLLDGGEAEDGGFVADIATMWDIYKTQLPLLFTLCPDISEKLLYTLASYAKHRGHYPHCILLSDNLSIESKQARMLAEYSIVDAYLRGVKGDYQLLLGYAADDAARYPDYPDCEMASHVLDMSESFKALSLLAKRLGETRLSEHYGELANKGFPKAFDPDGMMRADSDYYEGNRYNYSFRPVSDFSKRLAAADTDEKKALEKLRAEALRFFGYHDPESFASRFEGFNNETDMEAPYFLHFTGQRDLMCEVISSGLDSMFTTGRGGIPGNADSGGLTACYIWNALGLFPVSGTDIMIIGTPRFRRAVMHLPQGELEIIREGEGIYSVSAEIDGEALDNLELSVGRMMKGGRLVIHMRK